MRITVLRNPGSRSARLIAEGLRTLGHNCSTASVNDRRNCRGDRYVINWGVSQRPGRFVQRRLTLSNDVEGVANCKDKRLTLAALVAANVACIEFQTALTDAVREWLNGDKKIVVRRTTTGHSGAGIEIVREGTNIPQAPLYTRYFRKDAEYRVHILNKTSIHVQQKRRRNGWEGNPEDALVRSHANGYVFATQNLDCDRLLYREALVELCVRAAAACGVNHAAVDVLARHHPRKGNSLVVCELNSGPAVDADSTRNAYVQGFDAQIRALRQ